MTKQELLQTIHFRTIDAPCCGNCKYLMVTWGYINCTYEGNCCDSGFLSGMNAHNICDRFERGKVQE